MNNHYPWEHTDSSLTIELLKQNLTSTFVETGTNTGFGIVKAIEAGFTNIHSIDIEQRFVDAAQKRFNEDFYPNINFSFYVGDSGIVINDVLKKLDKPATFWLDGHSFHQIPLLNELMAIKNHHIKEHILLIDDVRMFDTYEWDNVGHNNVLELVMKINENYKISYCDSYNAKNDILIAKV
jgi:hypothetical protein